jgi:hypothetical protein
LTAQPAAQTEKTENAAESGTNEDSKLKARMDKTLMEELTIDELISMAESGKLLGHHMVARQFSENWLEAHKVPALRPIFERLRQERLANAPLPLPPPPVFETNKKRGLFSGLFGRN